MKKQTLQKGDLIKRYSHYGILVEKTKTRFKIKWSDGSVSVYNIRYDEDAFLMYESDVTRVYRDGKRISNPPQNG